MNRWSVCVCAHIFSAVFIYHYYGCGEMCWAIFTYKVLNVYFFFFIFLVEWHLTANHHTLTRRKCLPQIQHVWVIKLINSYNKVQTLSKHLKHIPISKCLYRVFSHFLHTHQFRRISKSVLSMVFLVHARDALQRLCLLQIRSDYSNSYARELYLMWLERINDAFPSITE